MLKDFAPPTPPPQPSDRSFPSFRNWLMQYNDRLFNYHTDWHQQASSQLNTVLNGHGVDIASDAAITVTNMFHVVTGSLAINTITQAQGAAGVGPLCLYAQDGFTIGIAGNCTPALTVAAGHAAVLFYSPVLQKWTGVTS